MRVVGPRDPREGLSGFGELLGVVEGATEVIPEASGVVRLFRQAQVVLAEVKGVQAFPFGEGNDRC